MLNLLHFLFPPFRRRKVMWDTGTTLWGAKRYDLTSRLKLKVSQSKIKGRERRRSFGINYSDLNLNENWYFTSFSKPGCCTEYCGLGGNGKHGDLQWLDTGCRTWHVCCDTGCFSGRYYLLFQGLRSNTQPLCRRRHLCALHRTHNCAQHARKISRLWHWSDRQAADWLLYGAHSHSNYFDLCGGHYSLPHYVLFQFHCNAGRKENGQLVFVA